MEILMMLLAFIAFAVVFEFFIIPLLKRLFPLFFIIMMMQAIARNIEEINETVVYLQKKEPAKVIEVRKTISNITTTFAKKVQIE